MQIIPIKFRNCGFCDSCVGTVGQANKQTHRHTYLRTGHVGRACFRAGDLQERAKLMTEGCRKK